MATLTLLAQPSWALTRTQALGALGAASLMFATGLADGAKAVPWTLQMIPVLVIGMLFTPKQAIATVFGTALLMAFTISAHRVGVTGGFMVGWVLAVSLMSWFLTSVRNGSFTGFSALWRYAAAGAGGYAVVWFCGWAWLAYGWPQFGTSKAFALGVAPFFWGAFVKLGVAVALAYSGTKLLQRFN